MASTGQWSSFIVTRAKLKQQQQQQTSVNEPNQLDQKYAHLGERELQERPLTFVTALTATRRSDQPVRLC